MNKYIKILFGISLFALPFLSFAECNNQLNRTLKAGMKGNDVKILQGYLNNNYNSKLKISGIFDSSTLVAFKNFQKKNYNTILKPAGLKNPNGIVGVGSRKLINANLCSSINLPELKQNMTESEIRDQIKIYEKRYNESMSRLDNIRNNKKNSSTDKASTSLDKLIKKIDVMNNYTSEEIVEEISKQLNIEYPQGNIVKILGVLPNVVKSGDSVYILGDIIGKENKIYIGNTVVSSTLDKPTDRFIVFNIPENITPGQYDLYFENINGRSEKTNITIEKQDNNSKKPIITSISPTVGNYGTEVTINGSGFTKKNLILTTTKIYKDIISSDGKKLKFNIDAEKGMLDNNNKLMTSLRFNIIVRNENGESNVVDLKLE